MGASALLGALQALVAPPAQLGDHGTGHSPRGDHVSAAASRRAARPSSNSYRPSSRFLRLLVMIDSGDLLEPADVYRVVSGCRRVYFGMSVSAGYLEATVTMAAVAREVGVNALVNMSQMTVSQMSIQNTTPSPQQRQHWLSEQALAWSGLPVVTIRPTVFLEGFFLPLTGPTVRDRGRIELPFGRGKTSPVATADVARVVAAVLADPGPHLGRIYELTGPRSQDMHGVAREYSDALNREVTYSDIPPEDWERELKKAGLPEHLTRHLVTMAELNRAGRYDRMADGVEQVTGRPAMSVREFVSLHADEFGGRRS
jgi:NAD(P)H dehydrogenase (quinone)